LAASRVIKKPARKLVRKPRYLTRPSESLLPLVRRGSSRFLPPSKTLPSPAFGRIVCKHIPLVSGSYTGVLGRTSRHSPVDWTLPSSGSHSIDFHLRSVHPASQGLRQLHLDSSLRALEQLAPIPIPLTSSHRIAPHPASPLLPPPRTQQVPPSR
jgi:hypothetical protein